MGFLDLRAPAPQRASNLALAPDGVPYVLTGSDEILVYQSEDGDYYFTIN